jgi:hypothetical protein
MAEKQKPKPKNPTKKMSQAEQSERFKETARKLGVDESGESFERVFKRIAPPIPAQRNPDRGDQ